MFPIDKKKSPLVLLAHIFYNNPDWNRLSCATPTLALSGCTRISGIRSSSFFEFEYCGFPILVFNPTDCL